MKRTGNTLDMRIGMTYLRTTIDARETERGDNNERGDEEERGNDSERGVRATE